MRKRTIPLQLLLSACLLLASCTQGVQRSLPPAVSEPCSCAVWLRGLDAQVRRSEATDASAHRLTHHPYLRSTRFLSAIGRDLHSADQRTFWIHQLRALDREGRLKEIANLPDEAVQSLNETHGAAEYGRHRLALLSEICSHALLAAEQRRADFSEDVAEDAVVPDDYSTVMRVLGLYPLLTPPVALFTVMAYDRIEGRFRIPLEEIPFQGKAVLYAPMEAGRRMTPDERRMLVAGTSMNPLAIPLPGPDEERLLAEDLAPYIVQDHAGAMDGVGAMFWNGGRPDVDGARPTVYYYLTRVMLQDQPVLQVNYAWWYPRRGGSNTPWIEKGRLDGATVRVSLDREGRVFMVDAMNNCGCYHMFVPRRSAVVRRLPEPLQPDSMVPQWLPQAFPDHRLDVWMTSGNHVPQRFTTGRFPAGKPFSYLLKPYDELESLPLPGGGRRSIFDACGIARGSERMEPLLLFPMGVPSVGSMRQRGNHPIELIGRAHFDDPRLFERKFVFDLHE